jgi:hypothetical protein
METPMPTRLPRADDEQRRQARRDARTLQEAYSLGDATRKVLELGLVGGCPRCSNFVKADLAKAALSERFLVTLPTMTGELVAAGASRELVEQLPLFMPAGSETTVLCRERLRNMARAVRAVEAAGIGGEG